MIKMKPDTLLFKSPVGSGREREEKERNRKRETSEARKCCGEN